MTKEELRDFIKSNLIVTINGIKGDVANEMGVVVTLGIKRDDGNYDRINSDVLFLNLEGKGVQVNVHHEVKNEG